MGCDFAEPAAVKSSHTGLAELAQVSAFAETLGTRHFRGRVCFVAAHVDALYLRRESNEGEHSASSCASSSTGEGPSVRVRGALWVSTKQSS